MPGMVSIVVPVYNAERYLEACLDSLRAQTYENIEIICVNDGSTDSTGGILSRIADEDARVRVVEQGNAGPGVARNYGMTVARGEYLYFADADDLFDPELVEKALVELEAAEADLVVFSYTELDMRLGNSRVPTWARNLDKFPQPVVHWRDNPAWLFRAFQNFPWNKMFRRSFVERHRLRYQEIYLTEDLMFSAPALVLADRIAVLDEVLVTHRQGTGCNVMAKKDAHPLDFIEAFKALRAFLCDRQVYGELRVAYVNWAIDGCLYNLDTLNSIEGFFLVYDRLKAGAAEELGLFDADTSEIQEAWYRDFLEEIKTLSKEEYLYKRYLQACEARDVSRFEVDLLRMDQARLEDEQRDLLEERDRLRDDLRKARTKLESMEASMSYKVGLAVTAAPRAMKGAWLKRSDRASV